ncbi:MAG: phytanoyl-CoA dioxygenase family protein [Rhodospirillales bacterium]|nr:phytanoyl-CoA dioxygenase family protein [Rhodospirillales bacterium]MBO6788812.1 phytanoyl-CoA dioxygenase family protein [Rhodospirillales bacterium]
MLNTPNLTDEDIAAFERDGYLVKRSGFNAEDMGLIDTWTKELLAMPEESGKHWVYHEKSRKDGEDLVNRIENIAPFHEGFEKLTEALSAPVSQLLGEPAVLFKEKVNFKMPGGGGFAPHQDSQAGWDTYADFFISALVSIDRATLENGCLQLVAGHHKTGLVKSWEPLNDDEMKGMDFLPVPTEPGDIVFFDCYAPHASEANMSDSIRRIYYATYNRASAGNHMAQYYADKHKNFPPDIDRDPDKDYVFRV